MPAPRAKSIRTKGEPSRATVVGIRVKDNGTDNDGHSRLPTFQYALEVEAAPAFTCGVDARLTPLDHVRLGQVLNVHHYKGYATIDDDAGEGLRASDAGPCRAPDRGIDDDFIWWGVRRRKGEPARITILDARLDSGAFGTPKLVIALRVEANGLDPFETELARPQLRPYSSHLEHVGATLPGWARPGKRTAAVIDWASAAVADPGTNRAPGPIRAMLDVDNLPEPEPVDMAPTALTDAAAQHPPVEGVDFHTWAIVTAVLQLDRVKRRDQDATAQQHGVPPGSWNAVNAGWTQRLAADWTLTAAAEAIRNEVKQQR